MELRLYIFLKAIYIRISNDPSSAIGQYEGLEPRNFMFHVSSGLATIECEGKNESSYLSGILNFSAHHGNENRKTSY